MARRLAVIGRGALWTKTLAPAPRAEGREKRLRSDLLDLEREKLSIHAALSSDGVEEHLQQWLDLFSLRSHWSLTLPREPRRRIAMIHRTKNGKREPLCESPYALAFTDERHRVTCPECKRLQMPDRRPEAYQRLRPRRAVQPAA